MKAREILRKVLCRPTRGVGILFLGYFLLTSCNSSQSGGPASLCEEFNRVVDTALTLHVSRTIDQKNDLYAEAVGVSIDLLRFRFDGSRLDPDGKFSQGTLSRIKRDTRASHLHDCSEIEALHKELNEFLSKPMEGGGQLVLIRTKRSEDGETEEIDIVPEVDIYRHVLSVYIALLDPTSGYRPQDTPSVQQALLMPSLGLDIRFGGVVPDSYMHSLLASEVKDRVFASAKQVVVQQFTSPLTLGIGIDRSFLQTYQKAVGCSSMRIGAISSFVSDAVAKKGLRPLDQIAEVLIDGVWFQLDEYLSGDEKACSRFEQIVARLHNPRMSSMRIKVARDSGPKEIELEAVHAPIPFVQTVSLDETRGIYLAKLSEFGIGSAAELLEKLRGLKDLKGLLLDLRYNRGGLARAVLEIADAFLDAEKVGYEQPKVSKSVDPNKTQIDERRYWVLPQSGMEFSMPLVLLINHATASAPEVLSQILQEFGRAVIVGDLSFGKLIGNVEIPLGITSSIGGLIYEAISRFVGGASGASLEETGIEPDVRIANPEHEELKQRYVEKMLAHDLIPVLRLTDFRNLCRLGHPCRPPVEPLHGEPIVEPPSQAAFVQQARSVAGAAIKKAGDTKEWPARLKEFFPNDKQVLVGYQLLADHIDKERPQNSGKKTSAKTVAQEGDKAIETKPSDGSTPSARETSLKPTEETSVPLPEMSPSPADSASNASSP